MSMPDIIKENIRVRDIKKEQLGDRLFFFDSNVWVFIFNQTLDKKSKAFERQTHYIDFWNKVTQAVTKPGVKDPTESVIERPVVAITSLVITETLNAHLRKGFVAYKNSLLTKGEMSKEAIAALDYKRDFRDKASYYKILFEKCQAEFAAAAPYLQVIPGGKLDEEILDLLNIATHKEDFNDVYYATLCRREKLVLVTDDGDFAVPGITILTANKSLLKRSTSGAAPKHRAVGRLWRK